VSEPVTEHDAVTDLPGAPPDPSPDPPVTVEAPWHNAPGTGAYTEPEVTTVRAYGKQDDGTVVAKVLEPPPRPRATRGRRASAKASAETPQESGDAEDADGEAA
jgi:hypothetical protein